MIKTRKTSVLRLLSVMALLLFAAPMMDGVLTLSQNESFDETTRLEQIALFETVAYAHPSNPSEGQTHDHEDETWTEKCGRALCTGMLLLGTITYTAETVQGEAPGGGEAQTRVFRETGRAREELVTPCGCSDDGDNDNNSNHNHNHKHKHYKVFLNDNDNDSTSDSDNG